MIKDNKILQKIIKFIRWFILFFIIFLGINFVLAQFVEFYIVPMTLGQALTFSFLKTFCPKFSAF